MCTPTIGTRQRRLLIPLAGGRAAEVLIAHAKANQDKNANGDEFSTRYNKQHTSSEYGVSAGSGDYADL
jgi:hypothetical protein